MNLIPFILYVLLIKLTIYIIAVRAITTHILIRTDKTWELRHCSQSSMGSHDFFTIVFHKAKQMHSSIQFFHVIFCKACFFKLWQCVVHELIRWCIDVMTVVIQMFLMVACQKQYVIISHIFFHKVKAFIIFNTTIKIITHKNVTFIFFETTFLFKVFLQRVERSLEVTNKMNFLIRTQINHQVFGCRFNEFNSIFWCNDFRRVIK